MEELDFMLLHGSRLSEEAVINHTVPMVVSIYRHQLHRRCMNWYTKMCRLYVIIRKVLLAAIKE